MKKEGRERGRERGNLEGGKGGGWSKEMQVVQRETSGKK